MGHYQVLRLIIEAVPLGAPVSTVPSGLPINTSPEGHLQYLEIFLTGLIDGDGNIRVRLQSGGNGQKYQITIRQKWSSASEMMLKTLAADPTLPPLKGEVTRKCAT